MIYAFLVLGCWLPFVYPNYANLIQPLWLGVYLLAAMFFVFGSMLILSGRVPNKKSVGRRTTLATNLLLVLSAIFSGHLLAATAMMLAIGAFEFALLKD